MAAKDPPPKRERSQFVEDAILRETVRKENLFQKEFTEFQPSMSTLRDATPDKPLVSSFCGRQYGQRNPDEDAELEEFGQTLTVTKRSVDVHSRYNQPLTTSMEIGWDQNDVPAFRSMFNHNRKKTDITMLPSRHDPKANVMTVKDTPPK